MGAMVGVLSESLVETMKAFYRMRSAYKTLEALEVHVSGSLTPLPRPSGMGGSRVSLATSSKESTDGSQKSEAGEEFPENSIASHPEAPVTPDYSTTDGFVFSGTSLCFGLLLLVLGLVPPSMRRIMAVVGFRGGEEAVLDILQYAC